MMLTLEQLKLLTPEQVKDYKRGVSDCFIGVSFNPAWSETRKDGFRDAKEEIGNFVESLYKSVFGESK